MSVHEQEQRVQRAELRAEEVLHASYRQLREAEDKAKEAMHRAEELKWRIDGYGIRPRRRPKRRAWTVRSHRSSRQAVFTQVPGR
jgi:hypothetical protein